MKEFERVIITKYKSMFPSDDIMSDPMKSCLFWGFQIPKGWNTLLENLFEEISKTNPPDEFMILQIKSKFGGLRFYVYGSTNEIDEIIQKYEEKSFSTCEICGKSPASPTETRWITTLCDDCHAKKENTH